MPKPNSSERKAAPAIEPRPPKIAMIKRIRPCVGGAKGSDFPLIGKLKSYKGMSGISKAEDNVDNYFVSSSCESSIRPFFILRSGLYIREVIRKNCTNPMIEPNTIPATVPHGQVPKRRSAPQPMISINATEANSAMAAEYAKPLLRAVSAIDSRGGSAERTNGSSFPVSRSVSVVFSAESNGGTAERIEPLVDAEAFGSGSSSLSRKFLIIAITGDLHYFNNANSFCCISLLVTSFVWSSH